MSDSTKEEVEDQISSIARRLVDLDTKSECASLSQRVKLQVTASRLQDIMEDLLETKDEGDYAEYTLWERRRL
jgi:hypothetical protein